MTLTAMDMVASAKQQIKEIDTTAARDQLQTSLILDVREPSEYAAGHLPGAINIPRGVLEFKIEATPEFQGKQQQAIIVYCQTGGRSALAAHALNQLGYTQAVSMAGGFKAWSESGLPLG
ncbi:MAG: rhodanese-like domain-containing protein [Methylomonas sp.]|jgi:rhodanese-related sulfurtransferase|uniref:rhodanese-like domain-containing protein n=1 Tax=Methylomonas sp. TaxID=418 RepID=UPI0025E54700|nr:rhodanese-like domain-containing protein [Methylomonas sp.]MCK9606758.1 rhodanese-like domain-containing protein [Methylomonas sp.]